MTAVTFNLYDTFRKNLNNAGITSALNINGLATLKIAIVSTSYVLVQNTHEFATSLVLASNEVTGTNYTARGNSCLNGSVTMNTAGLVTVNCNDPAVWAQSATGFSNGSRAILYNDTGVDTTSRLIGYSAPFATVQGNVLGAFSVTIGTAGIYTMAR